MGNIPSAIDDVFKLLQTEIVWLHARWKVYEQLFGHSDKQIELLNACAPTCFYFIQDVLFDEVQIMLSKLTDPATSGKFENLSLEKLQHLIENHSTQELALKLRTTLNQLKSKCEIFRERRNKQLAHLDLVTAKQASAKLPVGVSRKMVNEALELLREYMNTIEGNYDDSETGYEHFIMHGTDGEALVGILRDGLRYNELIESNVISFDDRDNGKWK